MNKKNSMNDLDIFGNSQLNWSFDITNIFRKCRAAYKYARNKKKWEMP